jgi:ABC-2 type transport system permease protein
MKNNPFINLCVLDLKKHFRKPIFTFFLIILPAFFYFFFTSTVGASLDASDKAGLDKYFLLSMIIFGVLYSATMSLGLNLSFDKSSKWNQYLKVSPVNVNLYYISRAVNYFIFTALTILVMFIFGFFLHNVSFSISEYVELFVALLLGSIVFLPLGLIVGELGKMAQPVGMIFYLGLACVGGLWTPTDQFPAAWSNIAQFLPTHTYANIPGQIAFGKAIEISDVILCVVYFIAFYLIYLLISKANKRAE